jgi:gamma-butyrobetaine dioxygenase
MLKHGLRLTSTLNACPINIHSPALPLGLQEFLKQRRYYTKIWDRRQVKESSPRLLANIGTNGKVQTRGAHTFPIKLPQTLGHEQQVINISPLYFRDSCSCHQCVDSSTRQKTFETSDLSPALNVSKYTWLPSNRLQITWENDLEHLIEHKSVFSHSFLLRSTNLKARQAFNKQTWNPTLWTRDSIIENLSSLTFQHDAYMADDRTLASAIHNLLSYGLIFIKNAPTSMDTAKQLAQRIGPLKNTFYGEIWDVKSRPNPKNVAYTSGNLDFHMDMLYLADPPSIQLLHCMKQSTEGGESRFTDAVTAFHNLQIEHYDLATTLANSSVTFHYQNDGRHLVRTRPFLEGGIQPFQQQPASSSRSTSATQKPVRIYPIHYQTINWSPPFQGPFETSGLPPQPTISANTENTAEPVSMEDYVRAAAQFKRTLCKDAFVFETKLDEGTCVIFNNRRILHARKPYTSVGGERWLRGGYVDMDYLFDRYRTLPRAEGVAGDEEGEQIGW